MESIDLTDIDLAELSNNKNSDSTVSVNFSNDVENISENNLQYDTSKIKYNGKSLLLSCGSDGTSLNKDNIFIKHFSKNISLSSTASLLFSQHIDKFYDVDDYSISYDSIDTKNSQMNQHEYSFGINIDSVQYGVSFYRSPNTTKLKSPITYSNIFSNRANIKNETTKTASILYDECSIENNSSKIFVALFKRVKKATNRKTKYDYLYYSNNEKVVNDYAKIDDDLYSFRSMSSGEFKEFTLVNCGNDGRVGNIVYFPSSYASTTIKSNPTFLHVNFLIERRKTYYSLTISIETEDGKISSDEIVLSSNITNTAKNVYLFEDITGDTNSYDVSLSQITEQISYSSEGIIVSPDNKFVTNPNIFFLENETIASGLSSNLLEKYRNYISSLNDMVCGSTTNKIYVDYDLKNYIQCDYVVTYRDSSEQITTAGCTFWNASGETETEISGRQSLSVAYNTQQYLKIISKYGTISSKGLIFNYTVLIKPQKPTISIVDNKISVTSDSDIVLYTVGGDDVDVVNFSNCYVYTAPIEVQKTNEIIKFVSTSETTSDERLFSDNITYKFAGVSVLDSDNNINKLYVDVVQESSTVTLSAYTSYDGGVTKTTVSSPDVVIKFTLDGSDPKCGDNKFTNIYYKPIRIIEKTQIRAIAYNKAGTIAVEKSYTTTDNSNTSDWFICTRNDSALPITCETEGTSTISKIYEGNCIYRDSIISAGTYVFDVNFSYPLILSVRPKICNINDYFNHNQKHENNTDFFRVVFNGDVISLGKTNNSLNFDNYANYGILQPIYKTIGNHTSAFCTCTLTISDYRETDSEYIVLNPQNDGSTPYYFTDTLEWQGASETELLNVNGYKSFVSTDITSPIIKYKVESIDKTSTELIILPYSSAEDQIGMVRYIANSSSYGTLKVTAKNNSGLYYNGSVINYFEIDSQCEYKFTSCLVDATTQKYCWKIEKIDISNELFKGNMSMKMQVSCGDYYIKSDEVFFIPNNSDYHLNLEVNTPQIGTSVVHDNLSRYLSIDSMKIY